MPRTVQGSRPWQLDDDRGKSPLFGTDRAAAMGHLHMATRRRPREGRNNEDALDGGTPGRE
jgi:hypothetical protein